MYQVLALWQKALVGAEKVQNLEKQLRFSLGPKAEVSRLLGSLRA